MKIKLDDVIEQIVFANESSKSYFNKKTCEIHLIPDEVEMYTDRDKKDDFIPEWEKELIPVAKDISRNPDNYISFPTQYDIHEYSIMERFCLSIEDDDLREIMYSSIKGSGAFRRFKENIFTYAIENDWYKYRDAAYKEIAIEWCKDNNIEFY